MTGEDLYNMRHPERVCLNPDCKKKFRARIPKQKYCCKQCSKADVARVEREKRAKEREEAEEFKKRKENVQVGWSRMCELMRKHKMSYGKVEDAIRNGRIKA